MIRLLALLFIFGAFAQPPTQEYDQQIKASDFFAEEYPNYGICDMRLGSACLMLLQSPQQVISVFCSNS